MTEALVHTARQDGQVDMLELAGERLIADPAGGLYWPRMELLVVADLHLEKGAAFAARGVLLPPYDTPDTLATVEGLVGKFQPAVVIALGDSFHRAGSASAMPAAMAQRVRALTQRRRWIWVAGNHDPTAPLELGGEPAGEVCFGPLTFRHEPRPGPALGEVAGHLHPVARLRSRGRIIRRRCFLADAERMVMPALGAYAGGLNVLDPAFAFAFPDGSFHAWMLGRSRVYPVRPSRLVPEPS